MKRGTLVLLGTVLFVLISPQAADSAALFQTTATYTVTSADDTNDGACDASHCSLREAVAAANASPGTDTIAFNLPGSPPYTIAPTSELPSLADPVLIDGATQPGYAGSPVVVISGESAGSGVAGLNVTAGGSTLRALDLVDWHAAGVRFMAGGGNVLEDSVVGLDAGGFSTGAAMMAGVHIRDSSDNVIRRSVLSGNSDGIVIESTAPGLAARNVVQANRIGVDASGALLRANWGYGVSIIGGSDTLVGGPLPEQRNVISGNGEAGVLLEAWSSGGQTVPPTGNRVIGNFIGSDIGGSALIGGQAHGVKLVAGSGNWIGGPNSGDGNLIAGGGSRYTGVFVSAGGNTIQGNRIGTNASGTAALSFCEGCPENNGVLLWNASNNTVRGNLISANKNGIALFGQGQPWPDRPYASASNNVIQGNHIGVSASGGPLPNQQHGIVLMNHTSGNRIGGTGSGEANTIAHNGGTGVLLDQFSGDFSAEEPGRGDGNWIVGNAIYENGGPGIDLDGATSPAYGDESGDGITANDAGDGDSGLNGLVNKPVLAAAATGGSATVVNGRVESSPSTAFTVHFYSSPACDSSGYGEGQAYLGLATVTTDSAGRADITASLPSVPPGASITATAADGSGSTSEFSACVQVTQPSATATPSPTPTPLPTIEPTAGPTATPTVQPPPLTANLLVNASFESADPSNPRVPAGWIASWNGGRYWRTCRQAHSGNCALQSWTSGNYATISQTVDQVGSRGDAISFSAWAKGSNVATSKYVRIRVYLINFGTVIQTRTIYVPPGTYDWQPLSIQFNATQPFTQIKVAYQTSGASGTAWLDDMLLAHQP